ncbi:NtaA/DmoA family FMN-dependent monooxygenase [Microbacterium paludicola]|uniref:NtaA/DmoA family FMN-dependent monooxygenase n=1 Tax=Microbacterium paludicola TaxID=300019 RepID=UPI001431A198|nr:NtaA/DmoA family FMN-dependent monooxygenase [Microbacterium paludicola]MBF0816584.1 NtaA/DmoA family FMN-dependent monooxygenase [Microbacterium paludicola]
MSTAHRDGQLVFNAFTELTPGHHFDGTWRLPAVRDRSYLKLKTWTDMARTLERGCFDAVFIADGLGLGGTFGGSHDHAMSHGFLFPNNDAIIVATAMAAATENLSAIFTSSLIQNHPFEFARLASTLDHLVDGRMGWNVVTSALENSFKNVGYDALPSREERYARADEFLEVVYKLWEGSWADDAVIADVETGVWSDPSRIRKIDHKGRSFSTEGPHQSQPSPQRTPFLATPGGSTYAIDLAAQHGELFLTAAPSIEVLKDTKRMLDAKLRSYGRDPKSVKLMQMSHFVIGSTREEAMRKLEETFSYIDPLSDLVVLGGIASLDLGMRPYDEPFRIDDEPRMKAHFARQLEALGNPDVVTIGQLTGFPEHTLKDLVFAGTPEEIADRLEEWRDAGLGGCNVGDYAFHGGYDDFVDHLCPVLQERGLMQREYTRGSLRNKVFGEGDRLPSSHPAAAYRWWA